MKPVVQGKHVYLHGLMTGDYDFLYRVREDFDELHLWSNNRDPISFEDYTAHMNRQMQQVSRHFQIIATNDHGEKIGMIYCYNVHDGDGYAYTTLYVLPAWRHSVFAAEAGLLYYHYLFRFFNYRKLYAEVYSYNSESMRFLNSVGFQEEGCLKEHRYYDGSFADLFIFSVRRDEFYQKYQNLLGMIERSII